HLFFKKAYSGQRTSKKPYRTMWFEVSLAGDGPVLRADIRSADPDLAPQILKEHGIDLFFNDVRLGFESPQPFQRTSFVDSPSGRRIFVNTDLQICYRSAFGVRYRLFGISPLHKYFTVAPQGTGSDLEIQEARWDPSEEYVLLRHVTHGLLVLQPAKRQVGILVPGRVDLFGVFPGKS
ncbi:MAG TPA: hypothetical protein VLJ10_02385, partial [Candidatus Bathyarchaeia archaeon]|nr:hypothetical protein [Candidatus Bathyarchaeia archaeon]